MSSTSANALHVSCQPYPAGRKSAVAGAVISTIGLIGFFIMCLSLCVLYSYADADSVEEGKKLEKNKIQKFLELAASLGMLASILTPFPIFVCSLHTYRMGYSQSHELR